MRSTIPRKQAARNEDFVNAWKNIEQLVSRDEALALVASTVNDIKQKTAGRYVAYAWSGGKDSLALQYVCEQAGIHRCVFCTSKALEYPAFLQWVYQYHPVGMTTINLDGLSLRWLADHPEMLFPHEAKMNSRWMEKLQYAGQNEYCQYYPIIVDEDFRILCGHGKKLALELLGETKGEVTIMRGLSEKQKLRIVVEDNKIQSMSYIDFTKVEEIIREIGDTRVIGFTTEYLEAIIKENVPDNMGVDFQEPAAPKQKFNEEKQQEDVQERNDIEEGMQAAHTIVCPHCGKEITL